AIPPLEDGCTRSLAYSQLGDEHRGARPQQVAEARADFGYGHATKAVRLVEHVHAAVLQPRTPAHAEIRRDERQKSRRADAEEMIRVRQIHAVPWSVRVYLSEQHPFLSDYVVGYLVHQGRRD